MSVKVKPTVSKQQQLLASRNLFFADANSTRRTSPRKQTSTKIEKHDRTNKVKTISKSLFGAPNKSDLSV